MKLLVSQKNMLADLIESTGADIRYFDFKESELYGCTIHVKNSNELLFNLRDSIKDVEFCDIYYKPTNKQLLAYKPTDKPTVLLTKHSEKTRTRICLNGSLLSTEGCFFIE